MLWIWIRGVMFGEGDGKCIDIECNWNDIMMLVWGDMGLRIMNVRKINYISWMGKNMRWRMRSGWDMVIMFVRKNWFKENTFREKHFFGM